MILDCDTSVTQIAVELSRVQDVVIGPICYASHVLMKQHRSYCTTRKELLAIVKFWHWIFFIRAGSEDNYKSLDEFEFRQNFYAEFGVSCPCTSEKTKTKYNLVSTLAPSFYIGSSLYLQVTRASIISRTSSNFSLIQPRTAELAALERLRKFP